MSLSPRLRPAAVAVPFLLTCAGLAIGAANAAPAEMVAPVRAGGESFLVLEPGAPVSEAWRIDHERDGGMMHAGYRLTDRVIVRSDPDSLGAALRAAGVAALRAEPAPVRGFATVRAGSVGDAVALAESLRAAGLAAEVDVDRPKVLRGGLPDDPFFPNQWHLLNTVNTLADVNAEAAWAMGYTGQGIVVGVTEGAFQSTHPDLRFNSAASQTSGGSSGHATSVAGVIGAIGNNGIGVTGAAYDAEVSSQIIGSSFQTASAFTFRNDLNDIKNDSWGPWDSGELWDNYASSIELAALEEAATLGRGGLGTITCWAAGNGGSGDRVDYDPYTSSRFTLAIGAIGDLDREASYNELGSSMLVVAHSSGNSRGITTTTSGSGYTASFGGTSSASPLGAGAVALALQANPSLTWRDVQALLVETARLNDPSDSFWTTNAAGHDISYRFGFGAIDAGALVAAAETWQNLPAEISATSGEVAVGQALPDNDPAGLIRTVEIAEDIVVESVVLNMNVLTPFVGDLRVVLTSPEGTESIFSEPRSFDSSDNISDYDFMTLRSFGESAAGTWTVRVADQRGGNIATWQDFTLTVYGTAGFAGCNPADLAEPYGLLDLADTQAFITGFVAGDPLADLAAPAGVWDLADVQAFIGAFATGCP